jgi:hypothetical protein
MLRCCVALLARVVFLLLFDTSAARREIATERERGAPFNIQYTYYKHPRMSLTPLEIVLFVLSGLYIPLVILPLVQLIRIHFRAPEVGWTTQKLFLTLTALSSIGTHSSSDAFQCGSDLFILLFLALRGTHNRMSLMQYIYIYISCNHITDAITTLTSARSVLCHCLLYQWRRGSRQPLYGLQSRSRAALCKTVGIYNALLDCILMRLLDAAQ